MSDFAPKPSLDCEQANRRLWQRQHTHIQADLLLEGGRIVHGVVVNLSLAGGLMQIPEEIRPVSCGKRGALRLTSERGNSLEYPCKVVRARPGFLGLQLVDKKATFGMALTHDLLELLHGIGSACANSLDLDDTLQACAIHGRAFLHAEASSVFLVDENQQTLTCRACSGPVDILGLTLSLDTGLVGKSVREACPVIVMDVRQDAHFSQSIDQSTGFVTRSLICVPLRVMDKTIGAFEVINKLDGQPFEERDQYILSAIAATMAMAIYNARQHHLFLAQERREKELALARALQESFLPARFPSHFPVHGASQAARELSGDFFDILPLPDGRIFFLLGDVSGKGANAGLFMARVSSLLRFLGKCRQDPAAILIEVNQELIGSVRMGMFVTLVAGFFLPDRQQVILANAGHLPPLRYRHQDGTFQEVTSDGFPLGISSDFQVTSNTFALAGDEVLILYSDGVTEATVPHGDGFLGMAGFQHLLCQTRDLPPQPRLASLLAGIHQQGTVPHDDITLVLLDPRFTRDWPPPTGPSR